MSGGLRQMIATPICQVLNVASVFVKLDNYLTNARNNSLLYWLNVAKYSQTFLDFHNTNTTADVSSWAVGNDS